MLKMCVGAAITLVVLLTIVPRLIDLVDKRITSEIRDESQRKQGSPVNGEPAKE